MPCDPTSYEGITSAWAAIDTLKGSDLEWSTVLVITVDGKKKNRCVLCNNVYSGGPSNIRTHLDLSIKPRNIRECKPKLPFKARHTEVLAVLRARADRAQLKVAAATAKQSARAQATAVEPAVQFLRCRRPMPSQTKAWGCGRRGGGGDGVRHTYL